MDRFALLHTDEALEAGLFGPVAALTPTSRVRLGDALLIARNGNRLTMKKEEKEEGHQLRGHHGNLTPDEMLVPLLVARLDALWPLPPCCAGRIAAQCLSDRG